MTGVVDFTDITLPFEVALRKKKIYRYPISDILAALQPPARGREMTLFETVVPETAKVSYDQYHFSQGVIANDILFASGIIGTDASGNIPEEDKEEFRLAWQGIATLLKEAGSGLDCIVEYTSFHVDMLPHLGHFMSVRDEYLKEPWPAWTAIGVSSLARAGARVEIKVTALLNRP